MQKFFFAYAEIAFLQENNKKLEKKNPNINIENIVVGNYQMKDSQELFEQLHKIYVEEKTKADRLLKEIDSIRFGKVLTGSFFDDITQDDKGNFAINYNSKILGDGVINVTMEKIVEGGDIPSEAKEKKENEWTRYPIGYLVIKRRSYEK